MKPYTIKYGQDARNEVRSMSELETVLKIQSAQSMANVYERLLFYAVTNDVKMYTVLDLGFQANFTWYVPSTEQADAYQVITNELSFANWKLNFIEKFCNCHMTQIITKDSDVMKWKVSDKKCNSMYHRWVEEYNNNKGNWIDKNTAE